MKVHELLDSREKWSDPWLALDKLGNVVDPQDPTAVRWSVVGALMKCYPSDWGTKASLLNLEPGQNFSKQVKLCRQLDI